MAEYQCPVCGQKANIDTVTKKKEIEWDGSFPKHPDCELAKAISKIDFSKLQKV
jgi:hypothetical protein